MNVVTIELHHGGNFCDRGGNLFNYIGGKVAKFENIDTDLVSYFEITAFVKELGYNELCRLYFKSLDGVGFILFYDDTQIQPYLKEAEFSNKIELYVEHGGNVNIGTDHEDHVDINLDDVIVDDVPFEVTGNIVSDHEEEHVTNNLGTDEGLDGVNVGYVDQSGDGANVGSEDDGVNVGSDLEFDFDSDVNSMEHCSDDEDDEELQSVRVRKLKLRKECIS